MVGGSVSFASVRPAGANLLFTFTCGLEIEGTAWCWGAGDRGQLGVTPGADCGGIPCLLAPSPVAGSLRFSELVPGGGHVCGASLQGGVYCWGGNASGQLGDGTTVTRVEPVLVALP